MAWSFEEPAPHAEVVDFFKYTKNRPGVPTESKSIRFDQHFVRQIDEFLCSGVDPRCKTFSDVMRDAGVMWLKGLNERFQLEGTELGDHVGSFVRQEEFFSDLAIEHRNNDFLSQLRDAVEMAKIRRNGKQLYKLRGQAYAVANRNQEEWFTEEIDRIFTGIGDTNDFGRGD